MWRMQRAAETLCVKAFSAVYVTVLQQCGIAALETAAGAAGDDDGDDMMKAIL